MKYGFIVSVLFFCHLKVHATTYKDSLLSQMSSFEISDTVKLVNLIEETQAYIGNDLKFSELFTNAAMNTCERIGYKYGLYLAQLGKADVLRWQSRGKEALDLLDELLAEKYIEAIGNIELRALSLKGNILADMGRRGEAIDLLYQCVDLARERMDSTLLLYNYSAIANFYENGRAYDKALGYRFKSISLMDETLEPKSAGLNYYNIGSIYQVSGNIDSALFYYRKTEELYSQVNYISGMAGLANNIAKIYAADGDYTKAVDEMEKALDYDLKVGTSRYIVFDYYNLGKFYFKLNKPQKSIKHLKQSIVLANEIKYYEKLKDGHKLLSKVYRSVGNNNEAFIHLNFCIEFNDTLVSRANKRMVQEVATKYESETKEAENVILLKEQESDRKLIRLQQYITALLVLILLASVIVVIQREHEKKKELNKKLILTNNQLKLLNETRDKFFRIISHDLRGPFSSILGITELLTSNYEQYTDRQIKSYVEVVDKAAGYTYDLLNNLLLWAKTESEEIVIDKQILELSALLMACIGPQNLSASRKNIEIITSIPVNYKVYADRNTLMTIVCNLVSNAIKFTKEGGQVSISAFSKSNDSMLVFSDTGVGMSEETISKIFSTKEGFTSSGTNNEKGTGLGLVLCKEFIAQNDGTFNISSKLGEGTEITIILPGEN